MIWIALGLFLMFRYAAKKSLAKSIGLTIFVMIVASFFSALGFSGLF